MMSKRRTEAEAANKRNGVRKDTWFLQSSPQGDMILGYSELDPEKSLTASASDQDSFAVWSREQFKEITGIDMSKPPAGASFRLQKSGVKPNFWLGYLPSSRPIPYIDLSRSRQVRCRRSE